MENTCLDIRWAGWDHRGRMQVRLKEFLTGDGRGIRSLKKLLKIIRQSDTPGEEKKILGFVQDFLPWCNAEKASWEIRRIGYEQEIACAEKQLESLIEWRKPFKRNSAPYKEWSGHVKAAREELRALKSSLLRAGRAIRELESDKAFMGKCLGLLQQGGGAYVTLQGLC